MQAKPIPSIDTAELTSAAFIEQSTVAAIPIARATDFKISDI